MHIIFLTEAPCKIWWAWSWYCSSPTTWNSKTVHVKHFHVTAVHNMAYMYMYAWKHIHVYMCAFMLKPYYYYYYYYNYNNHDDHHQHYQLMHNSTLLYLKAHLQPRGIARRGTVFIIIWKLRRFRESANQIATLNNASFSEQKQMVAKHAGWRWAFKYIKKMYCIFTSTFIKVFVQYTCMR